MITLLALALSARAADPAPLFDVAAVGLTGLGAPVRNGDGADLLARAGGELTAWVTPRVGAGVRADTGTYGVLDDMPNTFVFAHAKVRPADDLAIGLGVGTPIVWVEYGCFETPCERGPWERHYPIGTAALTWEPLSGLIQVPLTARLEVGGERIGIGLEAGLGLRAHRRTRGG